MGSEENREEALARIKVMLRDYDYVRFTLTSLVGRARTRVVPARHAYKFLESTFPCVLMFPTLGCNDELMYPPGIGGTGLGNINFIAQLDTFHPVPWVGQAKYKTAEVLLEAAAITKLDQIAQAADARRIARMQLEELKGLGYSLKAATEYEYILYDQETKKPIFHKSRDWFSPSHYTQFDDWFTTVDKNFYEAGVDLESLQTEYSLGQFEFCLVPQIGVKSVDNMAIFKQGLREMAQQRGWEACFLARHSETELGNGGHFNFSLINIENGKNDFYDENNLHKMSKLAEYWIGGILAHARALTAFFCPTTNCYQRMHSPLVPHLADWGPDHRFAMIRLKNSGGTNTYMENRTPSSLANPYLILAALVAAGIDGMKNKTPCPKPREDSNIDFSSPAKEGETMLPLSLEEALMALQEDKVIVSALGEGLVEWFVHIKTEGDLKATKGVEDKVKKLQIEREYYDRT